MSTFFSSSFRTDNRHENSTHVSESFPNDIRRLKEENAHLREELAQCQVDKEFVWSLWKKLQAASPDLTEAVALVTEREKKKTEEKDRKVLDILRLKDDKITDLQRIIDKQQQEISFLDHKRLESQDEVAKYQTENTKIISDLSELKSQIENEKKLADSKTGELLTTIDELNKTCEKLQEELQSSAEKVDLLTEQRDEAERRVKELSNELQSQERSIQMVTVKEEKLTELAKRYETQLRKITDELKSKSRELEAARRELSDLWSTHHQCDANAQQREAIICQLEQLQNNTEKVLSEYEKNRVDQTEQQRLDNLQLTEEVSTLRNRISNLNQHIKQLEADFAECEKQRDEYQQRLENDEVVIDGHELAEEKFKSRLYYMEREIDKLREKLHDKNRVIDRLSKRTDYNYIEEASDMEDQQGRRPKHARSKSETGALSSDLEKMKRLQVTEAKLEQVEIKLQLKETQLVALKQAHQRRLIRLKNLLTSYKLVREQLKVAEDELGRPPKKKRFKVTRPTSKQLQKEDTDAAWNELRFIKNENKNLQVIKMNLEEQLDDMAVKASEDAANIHTLQIQVETVEAELRCLRRQGCRVTSTPRKQQREEMEQLQAKLTACQTMIESLQTRIDEISSENNILVEEKRSLKFEINSLKKSLYDKQALMAELNSEITKLKRSLKRNKQLASQTRSSYTTPLARKYQQVLAKSLRGMNTALAVAERSLLTDPAPPSEEISVVKPLADRRGVSIEDEWVSDVDDEFQSETMSELASESGPEPTDSAVSLGEAIARKATHVETTLETRGAQTSPRLLQPVTRPRPAPRRPAFRDVGTSPHIARRSNVRRVPKAVAFTQVSSMKQRLVSLQLKVTSLTAARDQAKSRADELTSACDQLQSQVAAANTKLSIQKNTIMRLESEVSSAQKKVLELESAVEQSVSKSNYEQEKKTLEAKIKSLTNDVTKRTNELKDIKLELERSKENNTDLSDKLSRLERDVAQKRTLLEEQRLKIRLANENSKNDIQQLEGKAEEIERIKSVIEHNKTALESMKCQVKALNREKKDYEKKYSDSKEELKQKEKQLASMKGQIQNQQRELDEIQETARQQLVNLAAQGESAVSIAQGQLHKAHQLVERFQLLIKVLSDGLLSKQQTFRVQKQRRIREERRKERIRRRDQGDDEALTQAKRRAQEILNLTMSDIDDLLNSDEEDLYGDDEDESFHGNFTADAKRWVTKWEKALATEDFVKRVSDLFLNKIDEVYTEMAMR